MRFVVSIVYISDDEENNDQVSNLITMDDVNEALDGVDRLIYGELCPNVECILSKLIDHQFGENETPGFDFLCKSLNEYLIQIGDINANAEANKNEKTITLNEDFCGENADPVALAETILHESMHHALWAVEYYLNGQGPPDDPVLLEHYNRLQNDFLGLHHEFLAAYVDEIALTLWEMNGMVDSVENYRGLIWNGLAWSSKSTEIQNIANIYLEQLRNLPGNNPNNLPYEEWIESQLGIDLNNILPNNTLNINCE